MFNNWCSFLILFFDFLYLPYKYFFAQEMCFRLFKTNWRLYLNKLGCMVINEAKLINTLPMEFWAKLALKIFEGYGEALKPI